MKNYLLILLACVVLSCKQDEITANEEPLIVANTVKAEDVINREWVISSATVTPALTEAGKTSTDYMTIDNCINQFTYTFLPNGIFTVYVNAPACDRVGNSDQQKWTLNGPKIGIKYNANHKGIEATLIGNEMTYIESFLKDNKNYSITYKFTAKKKI